MILQVYKAQVDLLLQVLPYIAKEEIFALKGGTAINFFIRNMPRMSVDIEKYLSGIKVHAVSLNTGTDAKLNCQGKNAQIKIEVNTITRGHIFPTKLMQVVDSVQDKFGKFAAINVVSFAELYGGKICAAIDRQHPRDIFDVKLLLENEGFTDEIWEGFKIGLISHYKPINELLSPILKDQKSAFENQFAGMTTDEFTYEDYEHTRKTLIDSILQGLTEYDKKFLLSFEMGDPEWGLFPPEAIKDLPAVRWKLLNIQKLRKANPAKHERMINELKITLGFSVV
ncbi:MAG: nucleotidyl transferase AbiEii/AbiGii toxin family protein [Bacteroidota bacterium]|nr:nucleotidyl transferase AbiEii/AbiGii toxin family protein [Bacteroidota bacterium]